MEPIIITKDIVKFLYLIEKIYDNLLTTILNEIILEIKSS